MTVSPLALSALPALGADLEGGIFAGLTTRPDGTHHAVVLLPDAPEKRLTWKAAMAWAKKLKAELPTRPVGALLFANLKPQFVPEWHWTSDKLDGSYAWSQLFKFGTQLSTGNSYEGRARAVRLIPLVS
jgi:hypothetical protein